MKKSYCGLDFGTSNSTVAVLKDNNLAMAELEQKHTTIPSAIFFDMNKGDVSFGRKGVSLYHNRAGGRLMRSLKSLLGTSTMEDMCRMTLATGENKIFSYTDILGMFIKHLKTQSEEFIGDSIEQAVVGRPVHFVDYNKTADNLAQKQLEKVLQQQGFKDIAFQFEPVAAALAYESTVSKEETVLIVDMGGGTSDFSVVRISPQRHLKANRKEDILANDGVHIAGNDFDRLLSVDKIMPLLGYGVGGHTPIPNHYFMRLASWQEIQTLYNRKTIRELTEINRAVENKKLLERMIKVIEYEEGHLLAACVEDAKIKLTSDNQQTIGLSLIEDGLVASLTRQELEQTLAEKVGIIINGATRTVKDAGLQANDIQTIFMTGGSASIPVIRKNLQQIFPQANINNADMFGSVGKGLGIEANRLFH